VLLARVDESCGFGKAAPRQKVAFWHMAHFRTSFFVWRENVQIHQVLDVLFWVDETLASSKK